MKRTIAAAVTAMAFASTVPAYAANVDSILTATPLISTSPVTFSNFSITSSSSTAVSANLGRNVGTGSFLDRYIFAPTFVSSGSGAAVTNLNANLTFGAPGLSISGYTLTAGIASALTTAFSTTSLTDYNNALATVQAFLANPANTAVYTKLGDPQGLDRQLSNVALNPSLFYVISIDGTGGNANSIYSGNLTSTSVPEPATWAMMLAGFGLVGFAMRRQRQSHPKVRFAF